MRLCQFKNLFGVPKEGLHSIRIFNIAIVDVILTVIGAYLLSRYFEWNFWYTLGGLFILGIFLHWLFCVDTTINLFLGLT